MNTPRVSREQAEGLKKVGYDEPSMGIYPIESGEILFKPARKWNSTTNMYITAPTLDEAARWLREVKKVVHIIVYYKGGSWTVDFQFIPTLRMLTDVSEDTHDLAQSAGIDLILKKLTDGK